MTVPRGYPDYQSYPIWRGPLLGSGFIGITGASPFVQSLYVAQYAAVAINVQMSSFNKGCTIIAQWFTDAGMSNAQGSFNYTLWQSNNSVNVILPNLGNFLQLSINAFAAGT